MTRRETMPITCLWPLDKDQYRKDGPISEALFYISCKELNIPISISKWKEDRQGLDFYIFKDQIPIDVTINPDSVERKMCRNGFPVLLLPKRLEQYQIGEAIIQKIFNPYQYLNIVDYKIRRELKRKDFWIDRNINPIYFNNLENVENRLSKALGLDY